MKSPHIASVVGRRKPVDRAGDVGEKPGIFFYGEDRRGRILFYGENRGEIGGRSRRIGEAAGGGLDLIRLLRAMQARHRKSPT